MCYPYVNRRFSAACRLFLCSSLVSSVLADILELPIGIKNSYPVVEVEVGAPPTSHFLEFDTGSSTIWIVDTACDETCPNSSGYPRNGYSLANSSTATLLDTNATISYLGGVVSGSGVQDVFSIPSKRNHAPHWPQTFLSVGYSSWTDLAADGFLGLAFSTIAEAGTTTLVETLMQQQQGLLAEPRFSIYYGRELNDTGDAAGDGALTIGGSHEDRFVEGNLTWVPVELEFAEYQLWRANAVAVTGTTGIGTAAGQSSTTTSLGFAWAVFDTGAGDIVIPPGQIDAVYASIGMNYPAILRGEVLPLCSDFNASWSVTFLVGDEFAPVELTITGDQLRRPGFGPGGPLYCWPPFDEGNSSGLVLLGQPFLEQFYTVFDFGAFEISEYKPRVGVGELQSGWKPRDAPGS